MTDQGQSTDAAAGKGEAADSVDVVVLDGKEKTAA